MAGRTLGKELQRVRVARGMSIEEAAAKAGIPAAAWEALEAESAFVYAINPQGYADAARALERTWALVSG